MTTVATQPMTAEAFYEWVHLPENRDRYFELERGEVVEMTRPGMRHGFVCANVVRLLVNFAFARKRGYVCSNDTGVIVEREPDTVRGPDVMFFDELTKFEELERKFSRTPSTLAVEVLSPSDTVSKVNRRIQEQLQFGTPLVWLIDPDARCVTVYRPGQEYYIVEEAGELTGHDVLPDLRFKVSDLFAMPGQ
jgi:Uma2 family endonuclease